MKDAFGRTIDYLRVSVTDRCNLRCVYCMPEDGVPALEHREILTFEEIVHICRIAGRLGIKKIKLTGGEPLVRKNLDVLVAALKALPTVTAVTLTTNGVLLKRQLPKLLSAGLDAVNISLDTLDEQVYKSITRRDCFKDALDGLFAAVRAKPRLTVKVNCVPCGEDAAQLTAIASLARDYPVHVRFIEMMPIGLGQQCLLCTQQQVMDILKKAYGPMEPADKVSGNGPASYYKIPGFLGKIGFISAVSHRFCDGCNRVRLTADGYLKTCLQYDTGVSLKALLRGGAGDDALKAALSAAIMQKPAGHHFGRDNSGEMPDNDKAQKLSDERLAMFQIGG